MKVIRYELNRDSKPTITESDEPEDDLARRANALAAQHPGEVVCGLQATRAGEQVYDRVDLLRRINEPPADAPAS